MINTFLFYLIINILVLFLMKIGQNTKNNKLNNNVYKISIIISAIILIILIGFRGYYVGIDTSTYADANERILNDNLSESDEKWLGIGYIYLIKFIGFFVGNNYVIINCAIAAITIYFLYRSIYENSNNKIFTMFIFMAMCLHYQMLNQSRQMLAIVMIMYSYKYIREKNIWKYMGIIILTSLIHNSAIIMIPIYFIVQFKFNKKLFCLYIIASLVMIIFSNQIIDILRLTSYGEIYLSSLVNYIETSTYFNLLVRFIMLVFALIFSKKCISNNKDNSILYNMIFICFICQIMATQIYIFSRVTTYFFVFYVFLIPEILNIFKNKRKKYKMLTLCVILALLAYHGVYYTVTSKKSGYAEYEMFFIADK